MLALRRAGIGLPFMKAWCRRGNVFKGGVCSVQVLSNYEMQKRGFTYFDDFGKLFRDEERAHETIFMMRRERELQELMRKDTSKLEDAKRVCMQIKAYAQAQQMLDGELNDSKTALQYIRLRIPSWLGVHQIVHAPP